MLTVGPRRVRDTAQGYLFSQPVAAAPFGVLGLEHDWTEKQIAEMLEDEDPASFSFNDDSFAWRDASVATQRVLAHRELVTSLGSCSFDEPREDLRALNLL